MFRKMPFLLLATIAFIAIFNGVIPLYAKEVIYSLGLTVKALIVFSLPILIFMLLFKTVAGLARGATGLLALVLIALCLSNLVATLTSFFVGSAVYGMDLTLAMPEGSGDLTSLWNLELPKLISNDWAMALAIGLGLLLPRRFSARLSERIEPVVNRLLQGLLWIIPIFVAGFATKLIHDRLLQGIIFRYAPIFGAIAMALLLYLTLAYWVVNGFRIRAALGAIRNMLPAAVAGFSSMSSAAALPLTLSAVERNSGGSNGARLAVPTTVNIHLLGDCFAIPILAFAVMKTFGLPAPAFAAYALFACYFVIAKFSVAAIPGGGILVMLPILESQLGFTGEMASLITALYILFDPVITCANICGNGALAMGIGKISRKFETKALQQ